MHEKRKKKLTPCRGVPSDASREDQQTARVRHQRTEDTKNIHGAEKYMPLREKKSTGKKKKKKEPTRAQSVGAAEGRADAIHARVHRRSGRLASSAGSPARRGRDTHHTLGVTTTTSSTTRCIAPTGPLARPQPGAAPRSSGSRRRRRRLLPGAAPAAGRAAPASALAPTFPPRRGTARAPPNNARPSRGVGWGILL